MIKAIKKWWRKRLRKIDDECLWQCIKESSPSIEKARTAYLFHIGINPHWTEDFSAQQLIEYVEKLE